MMVYGEFNAFSPDDDQTIIDRAYAALKPGGTLLLEINHGWIFGSPEETTTGWFAAERSVFAGCPHVCLQETCFEGSCHITNHYVIEEDSGEVQTYTSMHQVYTDDDCRTMLKAFDPLTFYPSLRGEAGKDDHLFAVTAVK